MNATLKVFAKLTISEGLAKLPAEWQNTFKLMYGRNGGNRSVADAQGMTLEDIINEIPDERLETAMSQVERSISKLS